MDSMFGGHVGSESEKAQGGAAAAADMTTETARRSEDGKRARKQRQGLTGVVFGVVEEGRRVQRSGGGAGQS